MEQAVEIFSLPHRRWLEAEVFEIEGNTVTCIFEADGMTGYREIDDSDTSLMRPLGRRAARGTVSTTTISSSPASSNYSDSACETTWDDSRSEAQLQPEPEPEYVLSRDSLSEAVARIEQEVSRKEFQELAMSYLATASTLQSTSSVGTPLLPRGGGSTPRLARLAQQYTPRDRQRAPSLSDPLADVRFSVGDQVWIYSNSANEWIVGEVESIHTAASSNSNTDGLPRPRTIVRVMYWAGDAKRGKDIDASDRGLIRPVDGGRPCSPAE